VQDFLTVVAAAAAIAAPAHHEWRPQRWPTMRLGAKGLAVRSLERKLVRLRYLPPGSADRYFDMRTWHAVVAFQGWNGLPRDGVVSRRTRRTFTHAKRPVPWSRARGFEVHLDKQVLLIIGSHHTVARAIHISSGAFGTPAGHFRIGRRERLSWSLKYKAWMPLAQYFTPAVALHEFFSVPAYPASHGCVRIPDSEAPGAWRYGRVGMRVWTVGSLRQPV
jgi:hypothetical protein